MLVGLLLLVAPVLSPQDDGGGVTIELFSPGVDEAPAAAETTVGMGVDLVEFVIPGAEVRARPVKDAGRADVIVRIENVFVHGTDHRYNLEVTPLVEGVLDLRDHLERVDGTPLGDEVPEIRILVDAVTVEDVPFPVDPGVPHPGRVGGYTDVMTGLAVLWVVGLLCLVFLGRARRSEARVEHVRGPRTLAERLRPLVERAGRGELDGPERAELERLVLAHWREKRGLSDASAAEAMIALRADAEAGPLLQRLELWFHSPRHEELTDAEVTELLAPFAATPAFGGGGA
ncbi:MAG: hypothetical protein VXZ39_12195 [Planctomycetota bacterium]|nr:hypothetical protein [Planctomycetota bacterium]